MNILFAAIGPAMYRRPINEWRRDVLGLPPARSETRSHDKPVPILYAYSQAVVPRSADRDKSSIITSSDLKLRADCRSRISQAAAYTR